MSREAVRRAALLGVACVLVLALVAVASAGNAHLEDKRGDAKGSALDIISVSARYDGESDSVVHQIKFDPSKKPPKEVDGSIAVLLYKPGAKTPTYGAELELETPFDSDVSHEATMFTCGSRHTDLVGDKDCNGASNSTGSAQVSFGKHHLEFQMSRDGIRGVISNDGSYRFRYKTHIIKRPVPPATKPTGCCKDSAPNASARTHSDPRLKRPKN